MKKTVLIFLGLCCLMFLLGGCFPASVDPDVIASSPKITLKVVDIAGDSFVAVGEEHVYTGEVWRLENRFKLRMGQVVEIAHNGELSQGYPTAFDKIYDIKLISQENDIAGLYLKVFDDLRLAQADIDSEVSMIALDLSGVENLSPVEKTALAYIIQRDYTLHTSLYTFKQLEQAGLIAEENGIKSFPNGVLYTFKTLEMEDLLFTFDAQKWCSPQEMHEFSDCLAVWDDRGYTYKVGSERTA